jgi:hypothetical protein
LLKLPCAFSAAARYGPGSLPSRRAQSAISRSALKYSALISTTLPRRGVTTQPSTFASIQVSW